jgi:hypothetical protein
MRLFTSGLFLVKGMHLVANANSKPFWDLNPNFADI